MTTQKATNALARLNATPKVKFTTDEVADIARMTRWGVLHAITRGSLKAKNYKSNGVRRFNRGFYVVGRADLRAWLAKKAA